MSIERMNSSVLVSLIFYSIILTSAMEPPCKKTCGPTPIKYPFGSGPGCGSPRFHPYVACSGPTNQLLLTTHTGTYPITSVDYSAAVVTISPPCMSNCTTMRPTSLKFGLDWAGPFQLGPSTFILLGCSFSSTSSLLCDATSSAYLCPTICSCPGAAALQLPGNGGCCVYSPASLDPRDELDVAGLGCAAYSSVVAVGDEPTDPATWRYGVALKYTMGGLDGYGMAPGCHGCELSGGVCGYAPPRNSFVCVCESGNTTTDCNGYNWIYMSSSFKLRTGIQLIISIYSLLFLIYTPSSATNKCSIFY